jgi:hypothetical protein
MRPQGLVMERWFSAAAALDASVVQYWSVKSYLEPAR